MKIFKRIIALAAAAALSVTVLSSCNNREPITPSKKDNIEKHERENGLVCWGSSLAYGAYGNDMSIVNSIKDHMMTDECYIPIVNMGVPRETSKTVMARAGAVDIVVSKKITVPEGLEPVEITFAAKDKSKISPLRFGTDCDGGMSNVTIAGIEGILSVARDSAQRTEPKYYFTRKTEGEEIVIKKGERIISESMTEYTNYIPIVCIGDYGEWEKTSDLIKQQQAIIDTCENKDKFIIVGLFSAPIEIDSEMSDKEILAAQKKANEAFDKAMTKKWGEHYVNIREYLCSDEAVEKAKAQDVEFTDKDMSNIKNKIVPDSFKYDIDNLNGYAYDIIGDIVYDKLVELGYLYN
ncbi:MAG: hypothetical protein K2F81_01355 [Ruminococcus sp.]|nr:hypothetical protein [Ruminococcus sp.]